MSGPGIIPVVSPRRRLARHTPGPVWPTAAGVGQTVAHEAAPRRAGSVGPSGAAPVTPFEDLHAYIAIPRVTGLRLSPDGTWLAVTVQQPDPDGKKYISSIWRIPADGAGPDDRHAQRVTNDDLEDWFPHPSPDGKWLLFLSFPHGTEGHNDRNQRIQIRMIPMPGERLHDERPRVIVELTGGQGTINVNSWSPDSRRFAFVSYQAKQQSAGAGTAR